MSTYRISLPSTWFILGSPCSIYCNSYARSQRNLSEESKDWLLRQIRDGMSGRNTVDRAQLNCRLLFKCRHLEHHKHHIPLAIESHLQMGLVLDTSKVHWCTRCGQVLSTVCRSTLSIQAWPTRVPNSPPPDYRQPRIHCVRHTCTGLDS